MGHLFNTDKLDYVKNKQSHDGCILCAIRDRSPEVESYVVFRDETVAITLNLYPYNQGQLLIFPLRHIIGYEELNDHEAMALHRATSASIVILGKLLHPAGFNIGYNLGRASGASIDHIHEQVVPRYPNELGFLEILSGTRVALHDPSKIFLQLTEEFEHLTLV